MSKSAYYQCEFLVEGMHCAACELVIEKKLSKFKQVRNVDAQLGKNKVFLEISGKYTAEELRPQLSAAIEADGYSLVTERSEHRTKKAELITAAGLATVVMLGFILLQKAGLIDLVNTDKLTLPFVFLIGVVASLSSCMAVVGGLVLSLSSGYAQGKQFRPMVLFHSSRLISFFLLGGLIGVLGSAFVLTPTTSFILSIILFLVMLVMGLNLLDIFPFVRRLQFKLPKSLGKKALAIEENTNVFTPILLGAATFILPCGFTQSMQIYSLTTGNFVSGALTMFAFALGTLPVLGLISFASAKMSKSLQSGLFFKTAGFIILFFAIFNFLAALASIGLIAPIFNI